MVNLDKALLQVRGLVVTHRRRRGLRRAVPVPAVRGVDFDLTGGQVLGLVGESGCGKSSLARAVLRLGAPPSAGSVLLDGVDLLGLSPGRLRQLRSRVQYVPQHAAASFDPRWSIGTSLAEPLVVHGRPHGPDVVTSALQQVGLSPELAGRYPHELSGGQLQRVAIARALMLEPDLLVLDEPLSALDVSVQAGVIALLRDLRGRTAMLLIGHDLAAVRQLCDRVAVMYLGRIVETGPADLVYDHPRHPYTRTLLAAVPDPWRPAQPSASGGAPPAGEPPAGSQPPSGCAFHPRCPVATDLCRRVDPDPVTDADGRTLACHHG